ncbi:sigma-54-dependent transcriptional regulator [Roseovarius phycicola]|uniref:Sigma-54 dependent transcriptional regulator n=1 Tax=Roseovarius phycicola TaxID=3080976 RepID=A0ABZ2HHL7_9RHOB
MIRDVLIVDDDAAVRDALAQTVELNDLVPRKTGSFIEAKDHISPGFPGVILSDIRMPGRDGFHLLQHTQEIDADLPVILLTGEGDIPMAVQAMGQGAFDFLEKPCAPDALLQVLTRALQTRTLVMENRRLKAQLETGDPAARMLFGTSQQAEDLRAHVRRVAVMQTEVLVTGPPGAGVSKVAEVVHLMSPASSGPYIKRSGTSLDAPALDEALEAARSGSLFIDEITGLSQPAQYALLDRLDTQTDTRLIAGTTADLANLAQSGQFNAELYYRLDVAPVRIPSLAERPEDIPVLFDHYVAQAAEQAGLDIPEVSPEYRASLMSQDWPGNARSLMSAAMRYVLGMPEDVAEAAGLGLSEQMARVERSLLIAALGRQNGRASEAAKALKLPRKTFYDKLARYGIKPEDYRRS